MKSFILSLSLVAWFSLSWGYSNEIPRFSEVTEGIARGGRPVRNDLEWLSNNGYKLIINIESNMPFVKQELAWAEEIGIVDLSLPMDWLVPPSDEQMDNILSIMADESKRPLFLHCAHGQDRTGLVIGLYRVLIQKWDAQKAHDEMLAKGFHIKYVELEKYFWKRALAL